MKGKRKRSEPQNLRRFRAIVEEFTEQNPHPSSSGADSTGGTGGASLRNISQGRVDKKPAQNRKERRKEERKLKKMRMHAFKQHKPLPTKETLDKAKAAQQKAEKAKLKKKKKRQKAKERKRQQKEQEESDEEEEEELDESQVRKQGLKEANKAEDKLIKQLEKQMKMNKRKKKSLPQSFLNDGLDFILDAVDPDKLKSEFDSDAEQNLTEWAAGENSEDEERGSEESDEESEDEDLDDVSNDDDVIPNDDVSDDEGPEETHVRRSAALKRGNDVIADGSSSQTKKRKSETDKKVKFSFDEKEGYSDSDVTDDDVSDNDISKDEDDSNVDDVTDEDNDVSDDDGNVSDVNSDDHDVIQDQDNDVDNDDVSDTAESDTEGQTQEGEKEGDRDEEGDREEDGGREEEGGREDIYGRRLDPQGKVLQASGYIPPAKRLLMAGNDKQKIQVERMKKQLKGLVNRLSEANMQSISSQIESMFTENPRAEMGEAVAENMLVSCVLPSLAPDKLVMEHMMLVSILHHNVGNEVGAQLVQAIGKKFHALQESGAESGKEMDNLLVMLCHLFSLKVLHCLLIFDILNKLVETFGEKEIELILVVLKNVGFGLRKEDPVSLKDFIVRVQEKATAANTTDYKDESRVKFMLEIILAIKNNNMRKIPNYDPSQMEHLRKLLRNYTRGGNLGSDLLRISYEDLLRADERGRWWLVGSAWSGREAESDKSAASKTSTSVLSGVSSKILELARKQRMNTDVRKNIFCILMTSEDFVDAFEKLLRLGLKQQQEREIIHVIIDVSLQEKRPNQFYSYLAQKFCEYDRRFQMTTQFNLWDKFSEIENMSDSQINNMAAFIIHLIATKALSLSVFKKIEFAELDKPRVKLIKLVLTSLLTDFPEHVTSDVFLRVAPLLKLRTLREGLKLFMQHFILRNRGKEVTTSDALRQRVLLAETQMSSAEGSSRL